MKKNILIAALVFSFLVAGTAGAAENVHDKKGMSSIPDVKTQFFCGYCHVLSYPRVIKKAYLSWKDGKHKDIGCVQCHYPPEQLSYKVPEHENIPADKKNTTDKSAIDFMKTELEVLSRLITVLNMDSSVPRTKPRVNDLSCTTAQCHPRTGKGKEGEFWTKKIDFTTYEREDGTKVVVPYVHKTHFDKEKWVEGQEMHCTSCHQRESEGKHFEVNKNKCFLCHFKNLALNEGRAKCEFCHEVPTAPLQKQKKEGAGDDEKPITHKSLAESKVACESCHMHLVKGDGLVRKERCLNCHDNGKDIAKGAVDKKLMHKEHVASQSAHCFNCHEPIEHKPSDFIEVAKRECATCHPNHHKYQEILLAGRDFKDVKGVPGLMYSVKTNCLACHSEERIVKGQKVAHGSGKACAGCHTEKHEAMAQEWKDKTGGELATAKEVEKELLDAIENAKKKSSTKKVTKARELLKTGREYMHLVEFGGGVHNKKYSVMLIDEALNNFEDAIDMLADE